jgi:hypothetical protein
MQTARQLISNSAWNAAFLAYPIFSVLEEAAASMTTKPRTQHRILFATEKPTRRASASKRKIVLLKEILAFSRTNATLMVGVGIATSSQTVSPLESEPDDPHVCMYVA